MDFEFATFLNWLPAKIALSTGAIGIIGTLAVAIWYRYRAGSGDVVLDRLRRVVAAKHEITHDGLKEYMAQRKDREYFRFICRVKVQSIPQLERVLAWINRYEIGNDELTECRFHIEPRSQQVLVPTPDWLTALFLIFFIASIAGTVGGGVYGFTPLFVKITATNNWFLISEDGARSTLTNNHVRLLKKECGAPAASEGDNRPDPRDMVALCDLMANPKNAERLADWTHFQKFFGRGLLVFAGWASFWIHAMLLSAIGARRLFNRMQKLDGSDNGGNDQGMPIRSGSPQPPAAPQPRKRRTPPRAKPERDAGE